MNANSIIEAKENLTLRNEVIIEKTPFVIYMVSQTLGRYVETENDIEYLVGLEALNEAIEKYDPAKGAFESFAGVVIKNRVLDELRKSNRHGHHTQYGVELEELSDLEVLDLKIELSEFNEVLKQYNLSFEKMVNVSPTHQDTRNRALKCASKIASIDELVKEIKSKFKLPIAAIVKRKIDTRRFLYAHQNYILFSSLAYIYHFTQITGWIDEAIGGEQDDSF